MTKDEAVKIAKALGWQETGEHDCWIDIDCIPGKYCDYAESEWGLEYCAAGEESPREGWWIDKGVLKRLLEKGDLLLDRLVREKLRERWADRPNRWVSLDCHQKEVELCLEQSTGKGILREFQKCYPTEHEANCAALLWLDEQKGSEVNK